MKKELDAIFGNAKSAKMKNVTIRIESDVADAYSALKDRYELVTGQKLDMPAINQLVIEQVIALTNAKIDEAEELQKSSKQK